MASISVRQESVTVKSNQPPPNTTKSSLLKGRQDRFVARIQFTRHLSHLRAYCSLGVSEALTESIVVDVYGNSVSICLLHAVLLRRIHARGSVLLSPVSTDQNRMRAASSFKNLRSILYAAIETPSNTQPDKIEQVLSVGATYIRNI
jgi:hypothetical protein